MLIKKKIKVSFLFSFLFAASLPQETFASGWFGWFWGGSAAQETKAAEALSPQQEGGALLLEEKKMEVDRGNSPVLSKELSFSYKGVSSDTYSLNFINSLVFENSPLKVLAKSVEMLLLIEYQLTYGAGESTKDGPSVNIYNHVVFGKGLSEISESKKGKLAKEISDYKLLNIKRALTKKSEPFNKYFALKVAAQEAKDNIVRIFNLKSPDNQLSQAGNPSAPQVAVIVNHGDEK